MYKFYWNNLQKSAGGAASNNHQPQQQQQQQQQLLKSPEAEQMSVSGKVPELPVRVQNGVTVRVKDAHAEPAGSPGSGASSSGAAQGKPSGSHRVLLKLRRMSGGSHSASRPKSVPDASELLGADAAGGGSATFANLAELRLAGGGGGGGGGDGDSPSQLKTSRSMATGFYYNKTWNEKSLTRMVRESGQHNYENVYSSDKDSDEQSASGIVIQQLPASPRATSRARKREFLLGMTANPPPSLYRSKSCERPKMRDAFRDNFQRLSSNLTEKMGRLTHNQHHHQPQEAAAGASGGRPCVSLLPTVTGGAEFMQPSSMLHIYAQSQQSHGSLLMSTSSSSCHDDALSITTSSSSSSHQQQSQHANPYGDEKDTLRSSSSSGRCQQAPSLSLAHKMRGLRADVQKKFSRLRSRSAERISQRSHAQLSGRRPDHEHLPGQGDNNRQQGHILPSPVSDRAIDDYKGPFIGRARALVDYTPSPYDRDALKFQRGDIIEVITMNPSGLWKGKTAGKVGNFKFINVELLPEKPSRGQRTRNRSQSRSRSSANNPECIVRTMVCSPVSVSSSSEERGRVRRKRKSHNRRRFSATTMTSTTSELNGNNGAKGLGPGTRPKTVDELLKRIGLEEHLSVFVLNGYEDLDSFVDMDEAELDYLGITDEQHRTKLMTAVELLQDIATLHSGEEDDDDEEDVDDPDGYGYVDDTEDDDDGHNSLEGIRLSNEASSKKLPNSNARPSQVSVAGHPGQGAFQRLSFPRDSGCYASNDNLNRSSPASDRSSQSGVSSHPESGLGRSCDEEAPSQPLRPSEQAAKTRSLRDRRTVNLDHLENQLSSGAPSSASAGKTYEALLQKYRAGQSVERVNFEAQFMSAKSVFERKIEEGRKSAPGTPSPKKQSSPIKMVDAI